MSVNDDVIKKTRRQRPYNCESRQILQHLFPRSRILFFLVSIIFSFLLRSIITCRVCHAAAPKRPRCAKRDFAGRESRNGISHIYQSSPQAFPLFSHYLALCNSCWLTHFINHESRS